MAALAWPTSGTVTRAATPAIAPRRAGEAEMRMEKVLCDACEVSCRVRALRKPGRLGSGFTPSRTATHERARRYGD
ncbi:hypothetical protein GCM10009760_12550 [Kitasatospora kazusensis]|uniref:4Fe-4S Mo/W bis-MGD-type domain-containing protein n=1 Tax=Kitasatospora kazusensis TaxID=407974 RepID=A0ABP5KRY6_9ACTN